MYPFGLDNIGTGLAGDVVGRVEQIMVCEKIDQSEGHFRRSFLCIQNRCMFLQLPPMSSSARLRTGKKNLTPSIIIGGYIFFEKVEPCETEIFFVFFLIFLYFFLLVLF